MKINVNGADIYAYTDKIIHQRSVVSLGDMNEGVDHVHLQLRRDLADHSEIENTDSSIFHDPQIARMGIGMEEAVFKKLAKIEFGTEFGYLFPR